VGRTRRIIESSFNVFRSVSFRMIEDVPQHILYILPAGITLAKWSDNRMRNTLHIVARSIPWFVGTAPMDLHLDGDSINACWVTCIFKQTLKVSADSCSIAYGLLPCSVVSFVALALLFHLKEWERHTAREKIARALY
jgi:hypothetical protein